MAGLIAKKMQEQEESPDDEAAKAPAEQRQEAAEGTEQPPGNPETDVDGDEQQPGAINQTPPSEPGQGDPRLLMAVQQALYTPQTTPRVLEMLRSGPPGVAIGHVVFIILAQAVAQAKKAGGAIPPQDIAASLKGCIEEVAELGEHAKIFKRTPLILKTAYVTIMTMLKAHAAMAQPGQAGQAGQQPPGAQPQQPPMAQQPPAAPPDSTLDPQNVAG